jgi:hypothetical protein
VNGRDELLFRFIRLSLRLGRRKQALLGEEVFNGGGRIGEISSSLPFVAIERAATHSGRCLEVVLRSLGGGMEGSKSRRHSRSSRLVFVPKGQHPDLGACAGLLLGSSPASRLSRPQRCLVREIQVRDTPSSPELGQVHKEVAASMVVSLLCSGVQLLQVGKLSPETPHRLGLVVTGSSVWPPALAASTARR